MTTQSVFSSNAHGQKANASSDQSRDIPQRLLGVRPAARGTSETPALEEQQLVQRPSFRKRRLPGPGEEKHITNLILYSHRPRTAFIVTTGN